MREKIEELIESYRDSISSIGYNYYYGDDSHELSYFEGHDRGRVEAFERVIENLESLLKEIE